MIILFPEIIIYMGHDTVYIHVQLAYTCHCPIVIFVSESHFISTEYSVLDQEELDQGFSLQHSMKYRGSEVVL